MHHCTNPVPYLILTNIQKKQNIKNILLSSAAFGVRIVFVVGQKKFDFDVTSSSTDIPLALVDYIKQGGMQIVRVESLDECVKCIKSMFCCDDMRRHAEAQGQRHDTISGDSNLDGSIPIIGVEIDPRSVSLEQHRFCTSTAFMMGNEGQGMTSKQMKVCDGFVRIEQYGGGTASLNVSVSAGIVLQRFFQSRFESNS